LLAGQLKDRVAITMKFETIIPPRLLPAVRAIAPNCLRDVFSLSSRTPTSFFELIGETVLAPFSPATTGFVIEGQCRACRRDGHFNVGRKPLQLVNQTDQFQQSSNTKFTPFLKVIGNADVYCFDSTGAVRHWDHETGETVTIDKTFVEVFADELSELRKRKERMKSGKKA
jgi:hypothetical protein